MVIPNPCRYTLGCVEVCVREVHRAYTTRILLLFFYVDECIMRNIALAGANAFTVFISLLIIWPIMWVYSLNCIFSPPSKPPPLPLTYPLVAHFLGHTRALANGVLWWITGRKTIARINGSAKALLSTVCAVLLYSFRCQ